jgi:hypothetical protein
MLVTRCALWKTNLQFFVTKTLQNGGGPGSLASKLHENNGFSKRSAIWWDRTPGRSDVPFLFGIWNTNIGRGSSRREYFSKNQVVSARTPSRLFLLLEINYVRESSALSSPHVHWAGEGTNSESDGWLGWEMGIEPTTSGATVRCSAS